MSSVAIILGESGSGKSRSMKNLDPAKTCVIQVVKKSLPWKEEAGSGWKRWDGTSGNIFVEEHADKIIAIMRGTKKKIIVVDDYQYMMSNALLARWNERGYDKFSEVGYNGLNLFHVASALPDDVRVYIMAHTMTGDDGITKVKTPGKLMETYTVEGLVSLVLMAVKRDGVHYFATVSNGVDTVKSPENMFVDENGKPLELIPNDLSIVDKAIHDYGWVRAPNVPAEAKK